jgi:hypothetical protein
MIVVLTAAQICTSQSFSFQSFDYPDATFSQAFGINNSGQIVGATANRGFVFYGTTFSTLVVGSQFNGAIGINNRSQIVGEHADISVPTSI